MNELEELLKKYNYDFSSEQIAKFEKLMSIVLMKNNEFNLTAITEKHDFYIKHILDSLSSLKYLSDGSKVIDLGSGAGFPAVVLKIANDSLNIVMIDSVTKKVDFLNYAIGELQLKNINAIHTRIEDFAKLNFEKFDYCTSRAVAPLSTLIEYSLPFLKVNGKMIAYKGPNATDELQTCEKSLKILGGKIENIIKLNIEENERNLIIIEKEKNTPKGYPRDQNKPRIKPLN